MEATMRFQRALMTRTMTIVMVRESSVGSDLNNSGAAYMFGIIAKRFIRLAIVLLKQLFFFSLLNFFLLFFLMP
jgi:hypothetical protein